MHNLGAAGAFVEVIDILGDDTHVEMLLEFMQDLMGAVGLYSTELAAAFVIELMYERRIAAETVGTRHIHHRIVLPQTVGVAEGLYAAFGTDTGSCRYHKTRFLGVICHLC